MTTVWIVEDDPKIRANLLFQLREAGFAPTALESAEEVLARLHDPENEAPDLLLADVRLPGRSGIDLVESLAADERLPPTVIISGEASITETVSALKLGVHDFIEKPFTKQRLLRSIRNALHQRKLEREVEELRSELEAESEILGQSEAIIELRRLIAKAAPTDAAVLISGETGTGKELVANALHHQSDRRKRPFIKINCAAIPAHLIEDELFGHVRGAFTDAKSDRAGVFEQADGGTLFLDEIGDMDYSLQSRLLRVLEDGLVRRVGDNRERPVDVRLLTATHNDLESAIHDGTFREDLYFRLAGLPLRVPPLRERGGDVRRLAAHFLRHFCRRHRAPQRRVEPSVFEALESYGWPGNVRELKSLCQRLVVLGADPISIDQMPASLRERASRGGASLDRAGRGGAGRGGAGEHPKTFGVDGAAPILPLKEFKTRSEREYLEVVLTRTHWNVAEAARLLGVQRAHLHQKLRSLGIRRPRGN